MGSSPTEDLRRLLEPVVDAAGLDLEDLTLSRAGRRRVLRVVVDADGGVGLDTVAELSTALSAVLDSSEVLGDVPYVLEVSSPGVDRPLTERRHWRRATGRLVDAALTDGTSVRGRVLSVDDAGVALETDPGPRAVAWADLRSGRVEVEFRRPGDDASGGAD